MKCERCGFVANNVGPFRCDQKQWSALCAKCKIELTLTPEREAALAREIATAFQVALGEPFCACGRRWSDCDGSRLRCHRRAAP